MPEDVKNHFITNIEIKNFKCFDNFKAEGFGRVNLIGGKNNVGKTAFMEACYINTISDNAKNYIAACANILYFRNYINFINIERIIDIESFLIKPYNQIIINSNLNKTSYQLIKANSVAADEHFIINNQEETITQGTLKTLPVDLLWTKNNHFMPSSQVEDQYLNMLHDTVRLNMQEETLNQNISQLFGSEFQKFLMREKKPLIYNNGSWYFLSRYGDGIKRFISMVSALYASKDGYLYLDEIENGIHYTNLDKLWEIILTISKEQNVQVFATTHSKECIESFNRVQKELKAKDTYYFEIAKNAKTDKIFMSQIDSEQLEYELTHHGRIRGE